MRAGECALTILLALSSLVDPRAHAKDSMEIRVANPGATEQYDRSVDRAALASQERAISKLKGLLTKYRHTGKEPVFLYKLAELQQMDAAIRFRIAHGFAHSSRKALDLGDYHRSMRASISLLNELIGKFPFYEDMAGAVFMRGKAYEEVDDKESAAKDYIRLVTNYPDNENAISAYMALAEFSIEKNDHPRAIGYLKNVEKYPGDPHYPFALYKLAWSYYNLKDIPAALGYIEKNVGFYRSHQDGSSASDALFENTLLDATVFYLEGFEQKISDYSSENALSYFRKLESGPVLGKMLVRYAKLLRSHDHETDLLRWKDDVLASESARPESLDVWMVTFEDQLNKRKFAELSHSAKDIVKLYQEHPSFEEYPKAQKLVLDAADSLQAIIVKNKSADDVGAYGAHLAAIYDSFIHVVDGKDPRIPRAHYNLAETLFQIKDYEKATFQYRWIVENGSWSQRGKKGETKATVQDASLKAIASRYEVLRKKSLIPTEIVAKPVADDSGSMNPEIQEWVTWIDTHIRKTDETIDNFYFESNRALYAQGRVREAVERMISFAQEHPESKFAIPSASLALDSWIASKDWQKTNDLAGDFLDVEAWRKTEFPARLALMAADSFYKMMEQAYQAKKYQEVLSRAEKFLKKYATSPRKPDSLNLAANAALALSDKPVAEHYLSRLITEAPASEHMGEALRSRAFIHEENYDFAAAAQDDRTYLSLANAKKISAETGYLNGLRRRVLVLTWLSGAYAELKLLVESKDICGDGPEDLMKDCSRYRGLAFLGASEGISDPEYALDQARKVGREARSIWAAAALESPKEFGFRDRLLLVRQLVSGWDDLEPMMQYTLLPLISASVPKVFELNRNAIPQTAPLRPEERYITHRVDSIHEMENAATLAMKLPWARIRSLVLNEIAWLYLDLSKGLSTLPAPKGLEGKELETYQETIQKLVLPFEEKGQDLRRKAFETASKSAIEPDAMAQVADPFFQDNPSQAKQLKSGLAFNDVSPLGLDTLKRLDTHGSWKASKADSSDLADKLRGRWTVALDGKRWPQIAFYLQEATEKKAIAPSVIGVARAVALAKAGAQAEALVQLEDSASSLAPDERTYALKTLLASYTKSYAQERATDLVAEVQKVDPTFAVEGQPSVHAKTAH